MPAPPPLVVPPPPPPAPPPAPPVQHAAVITNPDWARRPNGDDLARYYPDRAQSLGKTGRAVISCTVTGKGTLTACSVVSEDPPDFGFGEAALKMSRLFQMRPKQADGQAVEGGTVRIPLSFALGN